MHDKVSVVKIVQVVSGDTVVIQDSLGEQKRVFLASVTAPRYFFCVCSVLYDVFVRRLGCMFLVCIASWGFIIIYFFIFFSLGAV